MTLVAVAVLAFLAGSISAVAGFGIGSILTPVLGLVIGLRLAVPAASIPHFIGNALRLWTLRHKVDRHVLETFGAMSAAGALIGALLYAVAAVTLLKTVFALFLILFGVLGVLRRPPRIAFSRRGAMGGGFASGLLGGLIGNQGGIRAAAMLALGVPREAFVATTVAIALVVDGARMPVYAFTKGRNLIEVWPVIAVATGGVVLGTLFGKTLFSRIDETTFRRLVAMLLVLLGIAILAAP